MSEDPRVLTKAEEQADLKCIDCWRKPQMFYKGAFYCGSDYQYRVQQEYVKPTSIPDEEPDDE